MPRIDLRAEYPHADEWFYEVNIAANLMSKPRAMLPTSSRKVELVDVETSHSFPAYRKWDHSNGRNGGAREKIASDLAQILGVLVPATLLWRDQEIGCVQKEPEYFQQTVKVLLRAAKIAPLEFEDLKARLVNAYQPENLLFDLWLCNRDRATNLNNLLVSENRTATLIWLIDYDCALGQKPQPWSYRHHDEHGFEDTEPPVPAIFVDSGPWVSDLRKRLDTLIEKFGEISEHTIQYLCCRAFSFYGNRADSNGNEVAECLISRRSRLKDWLWQLIKS